MKLKRGATRVACFAGATLILTAMLSGCKKDDKEKEYVVKFESNGGSAVAFKTVKEGGKVTEPPAPTKDGFTFDAWYKGSDLATKWNFATDVVTADITLYAGWAQNAFTVTFKYGENALATVNVAAGAKVTEPAMGPPEGYRLIGWFTDSGFTNQWNFGTGTVDDDMTLYVKLELLFTVKVWNACESLDVWSSWGNGEVSLDETDKKEGDACVKYECSLSPYFELHTQTEPFDTEVSMEFGILAFDFYISDASVIQTCTEIRFQLHSCEGDPDLNAAWWGIWGANSTPMPDLKNGWNKVEFRLSDSRDINGMIMDLSKADFFRLIGVGEGNIVFKIDNIRFYEKED